jgi:hypothetical protein
MFKIFRRKKLFKECVKIEQRIDDLKRFINLQELLIKGATTQRFINACRDKIREAKSEIYFLEFREKEILNELYPD